MVGYLGTALRRIGAAFAVALALCQPVLADDVLRLPDIGNMADFRGQNGATGTFEVTGALDGRVFGTGIYTDDSDVPTAAVHAGLVGVGETRNLTIKILAGKSQLSGIVEPWHRLLRLRPVGGQLHVPRRPGCGATGRRNA